MVIEKILINAVPLALIVGFFVSVGVWMYFLYGRLKNHPKPPCLIKKDEAPWIPIMEAQSDEQLARDLQKLYSRPADLPTSYMGAIGETKEQRDTMVLDFMRICQNRGVKEKNTLMFKIKYLDGTEREFKSLVGANLRFANLRGANLRGANLRGADLRFANLRDANLGYADLRDADLSNTNLWNANLKGTNLWNANLWNAYLIGANLRDANLKGANLEGANLEGANLIGADLDTKK